MTEKDLLKQTINYLQEENTQLKLLLEKYNITGGV